MNFSIENLEKVSSESIFKRCHSENGNFKIVLEIEAIDETIQFAFKTHRAELDIPESENLAFRTCSIEFTALEELLDIENGIYIPKSEFADFMQQNRQHLNLAYGLRQRDYRWILSFKGSSRLASFIIKTEHDIEITSYNENLG